MIIVNVARLTRQYAVYILHTMYINAPAQNGHKIFINRDEYNIMRFFQRIYAHDCSTAMQSINTRCGKSAFKNIMVRSGVVV
jgi:hypothetical protein